MHTLKWKPQAQAAYQTNFLPSLMQPKFKGAGRLTGELCRRLVQRRELRSRKITGVKSPFSAWPSCHDEVMAPSLSYGCTCLCGVCTRVKQQSLHLPQMSEHPNDPDDPRLCHCVMTSSVSCHLPSWLLVTDAGFKFVLFQVWVLACCILSLSLSLFSVPGCHLSFIVSSLFLGTSTRLSSLCYLAIRESFSCPKTCKPNQQATG